MESPSISRPVLIALWRQDVKQQMSHRQNSRINPSSDHCSCRFWTVTSSFCRERSASHEEWYRFAGLWEPEGLPLLAGHHIFLQGIRKMQTGSKTIWLYGVYCLLLKCIAADITHMSHARLSRNYILYLLEDSIVVEAHCCGMPPKPSCSMPPLRPSATCHRRSCDA